MMQLEYFGLLGDARGIQAKLERVTLGGGSSQEKLTNPPKFIR